MSDAAQLVPVTALPASLVPAKRESTSLSPAVVLQKLTPYSIVDGGPLGMIYYFLKVGAKEGTVSLRSLPPEVARQVAMVVVKRGAETFSLSWYPPGGEEAQVHTELPMSAMGQVVDDLIQCGFR